MAISVEDIKQLRAKTSAGLGLCKEALTESKGDMQEAVKYINAKSDVIGRIQNATRAKIGLCKMALEEAQGDFEKAVEIIKANGWDNPLEPGEEADKGEGMIETYSHNNGQLVALVEVVCRTDFVARNENFKEFSHELVLQIAAMKPKYVSKEGIPQEELEKVTELFKKETLSEGKPENMVEKIVEGKLQKYLSENCLLEQKWFKDESKSIQNLLDEAIQTLGEPISIRRILIWEFGNK